MGSDGTGWTLTWQVAEEIRESLKKEARPNQGGRGDSLRRSSADGVRDDRHRHERGGGLPPQLG